MEVDVSKVFIISDTHFGHDNIIQYSGRPFATVELMDECIRDNWNETVKDEDIIYHLGDVYMGSAPSFLYNLKGRKRLVLGNHDNPKDQALQKVFEKIMIWRKFPEYKCILTHVPLHDNCLLTGSKYDWSMYINVHGHTHTNDSPSKWHVNACVEKTDYKPIELEELLDRCLEKQKSYS